jgi:hypothetical protein
MMIEYGYLWPDYNPGPRGVIWFASHPSVRKPLITVRTFKESANDQTLLLYILGLHLLQRQKSSPVSAQTGDAGAFDILSQ